MRSFWLRIGSLAMVAASAASAQKQHPLAAVSDYTMPPTGYVTVPAQGGLTFSMKVNGQGPFDTVFDSGAVNLVSTALAQKLGLKVEERPTDLGAIGGAVRAKTAHIDKLEIGAFVVRNQDFFVLDLPAGQGIPQLLIGWEFLLTFEVRVDFQHQELTWLDPSHYAPRAGSDGVPLLLNEHGNGIYLKAKVDGIEGLFQLDTGNETGFFLNAGFVDEHHLREKLHATLQGYNGKGLGGDAPEAWFARVGTLDLGPVVLHDPIVHLLTTKDNLGQSLAGNIGQSILRHFAVTIDCRDHVMYLDKLPNGDAREPFSRSGFLYDHVDEGDVVKTVFPGTSAEAVGLKRGDLVVAINGKSPADDPCDPAFLQLAGTVVHLSVKRNNVTKIYDITLKDLL